MTTPTLSSWYSSSASWSTGSNNGSSYGSTQNGSYWSSSTTAAATAAAANPYCSLVCTYNNTSTVAATTQVVGIVANAYANFYIGVILGIVQTVLNGFSFLFNKKAQQRLIKRGFSANNSVRYLLDWMWWLAMVLLVSAEAMNFVAYIFAPATVVAPLGALQIVACAIIAWIFLKEHLNIFGQVGCVLTIIGTTLIVIFAPESGSLANIWELWLAFLHPAWLVYLGIVIVVDLFLCIFANPKWGKKIVFIPVTITASVGSITVMTAKGLGVGLSELFRGDLFPVKFWFTYVILAAGAASVVLQIVYLNMAIAQYNINMVAPILYVEFTSLTIAAGAILLNELSSLQYQAIVALVLGFTIIIVGLFLITSFKDVKFGWRDWFFFMFKRKQTEAAAAAAAAETNGDTEHQQLGESNDGTPDSAAATAAAAGASESDQQAAGGKAGGSGGNADATDGVSAGADGDLATPKSTADLPDGSAPSPAAPNAAPAAASSSSTANVPAPSAENAPEAESPTNSEETDAQNKKGKKSGFLNFFKRKKDKEKDTAEKAGTADTAAGGDEKDTVKDSIKKTWYRLTDLNAFGSKGNHKLLHSSKNKSGSQLSLSVSPPATTSTSGTLPTAAVESMPTVGEHENAAFESGELPGEHTQININDAEPEDQLGASTHSAKMLLGVRQQLNLQLHDEQRRGSGSSGESMSQTHPEGSVLISELPPRVPPLFANTSGGEVNAGFEVQVPTPRVNANPFAPNAQTPRGSHSSGSTPRVEIQMVGVASTAGNSAAPSPKPAYSNLAALRVGGSPSPSQSPRSVAVAGGSSPIASPAAVSAEPPLSPFIRAPSLASSDASYSLDALAAASFEERFRVRSPSETPSVVTVRAAIPIQTTGAAVGGAHISPVNGFYSPTPPPVSVGSDGGRVDFV